MIKKKKGRRSLSRVQHKIFVSDSIGLFTVSKFMTCGKFRYQIDIISKTYPYLKSAITLWVKRAHLAALQLSNTGLLLEFIASNKLISPYNFSVFMVHFRFREAELGCWTLYLEGTLIVYVEKNELNVILAVVAIDWLVVCFRHRCHPGTCPWSVWTWHHSQKMFVTKDTA